VAVDFEKFDVDEGKEITELELLDTAIARLMPISPCIGGEIDLKYDCKRHMDTI
jgi:hypothetical protein